MRRRMRWLPILMVIAPASPGQSLLDQVSLRSMSLGGLHLYGASVFSGYSTSVYPQGGFASFGNSQFNALGGDTDYGASFAAGWRHSGPRTSLSVGYTGTYSGNAHYTQLNGFNQSLNVNLSRTIRGKWTANLSASGGYNTTTQFLYEASSLSVLAQLPMTFDDLAAAFAIGQFSSAQAASMLTGAPLIESPVRNLLTGDRILSYSAQAGLSYAHSSRLRFHFGSVSAVGQSWHGSKGALQADSTPRNLGATGGLGMSYALSSRTSVNFDVDESQSTNRYQTAYVTSARASLGRKMGLHWFLTVSGGAAFNRITQQTYGTAGPRTMIGGASLGYQASTYTLLGTYERTASDGSGIGVGTITNYRGAWSWHPRGSSWSWFAGFSRQQMRNTGFASLTGSQISTGLSRRLSFTTSMMAEYVYSDTDGTYLGKPGRFSVQSARIVVSWTPQSPLH